MVTGRAVVQKETLPEMGEHQGTKFLLSLYI